MSIDDDVDRLLRQAWDAARAEGRSNLHGVREGAIDRARGIRRRRRLATGAMSAVAAAALVAGVGGLTGGGWSWQDRALTDVTPANSSERWADLTIGVGNQAYGFPRDVYALSVPPGFGLVDYGRVASSKKQDVNPLRLAGMCTQFEESVERRKSVASSRWDYVTPQDPTGTQAGAELSMVGFATGTGADAFRDFRAKLGPCVADPDLALVSWKGQGDDSALLQTATTLASRPHRAMAVVRVGDILVFGSARAGTASLASAAATAIATQASTRLTSMAYPPAVGKALGSSSVAPNEASKVGAPQGDEVVDQNAYDFGDVLPDAASLPNGVVYDGSPVMGTNAAPVMGLQGCDSSSFEDAGADVAPKPVALVRAAAWAGRGEAGDDGVDVTVSGWATGTGAARFADLQSNTMTCRFSQAYNRLDWAGRDTRTTWLSEHPYGGKDGYAFFLAAQRVGDVIVAVVTDQQGENEAAKQNAIRLSDEVVAKLRASDLPAAKGR